MSSRSRESFVEALWRRASDPKWLGLALVVAGGFGVLSVLDVSRAMAPAERFAGSLAASLAVMVAAQAGLSANQAQKNARWWAPLSRGEAGPRDALLTVVGVWLVAVIPSMWLVAGAVPSRAIGAVEVPEGETAERFVADAPEAGLPVSLGAGLRVDSVDASTMTADVRAVFADGRSGDVASVELGDRFRLGQRTLTFDGMQAQPVLGEVVLQATPPDGAAPLSLTMRPQGREDLPDGSSVELRSASGSYLGQLGPAVEVVVRDAAGDLVRSAWLFAEHPAFESRHVVEGWTFSLDELRPRWVCAFRVSLGPTGALPVPALALGWLVVVLVWMTASRSTVLRWSIQERSS